MDVYVVRVDNPTYPYDSAPSTVYPELNRLNYSVEVNKEKNEIYDAIRSILINLGFDKENINKDFWNPFKDIIKPGQKVMIKPNLVRGDHPNGDEYVISMITNATVVRPIIDYILLATDGVVDIVIGDVPLQDCNWQHVIEKSGLIRLVEFYHSKGVEIKLVDLRLQIAHKSKYDVVDYKIKNANRSEEMYLPVDLGDKSELIDIIDNSKHFEITDYGKGTVSKHHDKKRNEYLIPIEILKADVFINIPKLKTHRKAGITCAMKNLIGINGDKSWIAHHTSSMIKGDEFSDFDIKVFVKVRVWNWLKRSTLGIKIANIIKCFFQRFVWGGKTYKQVSSQGKDKVFFEGSWYGNDTLWRCIKDLNKIILYADKNGKMRDKEQRQYLCFVDAVLAGEGEGPMEQRTKKFGVVFGGMRASYVDYVSTLLMRYDYNNIPSVKNAFNERWWSLAEKRPEELNIGSNKDLSEIRSYFEPTAGWKKVLYRV